MREILFRGKRKDNGEWVEGFYYERKDSNGVIIESVIIEDAYLQITQGQRYLRSNLYQECYPVIPETVGQFTGLLDKNGEKIFEHDIICYEEENGKIVYDEGMFSAEFETYTADFGNIYDFRCEIIGNIRDNPELLEVE